MSNISKIHVRDRDGNLEPLDYDKIHTMLSKCAEGLNVSVSDVALNAHLKIADKMSTIAIQHTLVKSAGEKITPQYPDYAMLAGRLMVTNMRKEVYGSFHPTPFIEYIKGNVDSGLYSPEILEQFSTKEINELGEYIDYDNDMNRVLSSVTQLESKYLIKDVKTNKPVEMIQETFMLIPMVIFAGDGDKRMDLIKQFYDALKNDEVSLPTPIISGVRTRLKMFSSCCKIKMGDTTDSILATEYALSLMTANRAGIGVDMGEVRGIMSPVKNNTVKHTGALPLLKNIESASKQFTQNSLRTGATVVNYPIFNFEIMDVLEYKNNLGSSSNRARFIDYSIGIPDLFMHRVIKKQNWTLFSSEEVPNLFTNFGKTEEFNEAYEAYEKTEGIRKITLPATEVFNKLIKERVGTGRIYLHFIDNSNKQGMFSEPITMVNLCSEIFLPTKPMKFDGLKKEATEENYDLNNGQISLCILGCINFGKLENIDRLDRLTALMVRFLDNLIDIQEYPMDATEWPTKGYRFLGIGISDFAHFLAKNEAVLGTNHTLKLTHQWAERFQFGLTKASMNLAKEKGACKYFDRTEYSKGKLVIDTYNKNLDQIVENNLECDWEGLRSDIAKYGMRNTALSAIPPTASSALVSNSTQGLDPIQSYTDTYESAAYTVKSVIPDIQKAPYYMMAWDFPGNTSADYLKLTAVLAKWIDQGMSTNQWYNISTIPGRILDSNRVKRDIFIAWKYGHKSLYYLRSKDKEDTSGVEIGGCDSGACSI